MRLAIVLAFVVSLISPARAQDEAAAAQTVIRSQVDAFTRNDAGAAYGFAAPQIHDLFPQAETFMGMVQTAYPPIYRHKRFEFGASQVGADGKIIQRVGIVDADDVAWEAVYTLERQSDGSLKISGCVLLKVGTAV